MTLRKILPFALSVTAPACLEREADPADLGTTDQASLDESDEGPETGVPNEPDHTWPDSPGLAGVQTPTAATKGNKILTTNNGMDYVNECRNRGVDVPNRVLDDELGWDVSLSPIENLFMEPNLADAKLWTLVTDNDTVCMALPRAIQGSEAALVGMICMAPNGNTCYFTTNTEEFSFPTADDSGFPIEEMIGGTDLEPAAGLSIEGVCSDCHAGENPFIIHPEDVGFEVLIPPLVDQQLHRPNAWPTPIVPESFPPNPQPIGHLGPVPAGQAGCDDGACHNIHRFPLLSTDYPGYCNEVLKPAIGEVMGIPNTMPLSTTGLEVDTYADHVDWLLAACEAPPGGGVIVPFTPPPLDINPPGVDASYACTSFVHVSNAIYGADLKLRVNGAHAGTGVFADPVGGHLFELKAALETTDVVTVTQTFAGLTSDAAAVAVRDHTNDYPMGLPAPTINPAPLYECASALAVANVPGATLEVRRVDLSGATTTYTVESGAGHSWLGSVGPAFTAETLFDVRQTLCKDTSDWSATEEVTIAPAAVPELQIDPPHVVAGQPVLRFKSVVQGSRVTIDEQTQSIQIYDSASVPYQAWRTEVTSALGGAVQTTDEIVATQSLCGVPSTAAQIDPVACTATNLIPAIAPPLNGDDFVLVTTAIPGSNVRVFDSASNELGQGSSDAINLSRELSGGELVYVVAELPGCPDPSRAFSIVVNN